MLRKQIYRALSSGTPPQPKHYNMIGPPDRVSNIRPIKLRKPKSPTEVRVHELQAAVWNYNHDFWTRHNTDFQEGKTEFARSTLTHRDSGDQVAVSKLTASELSLFYKEFLNNKYSQHVNYTRGWLKLQWVLTWNLFKLNVHQLFQVLRRTKNNND